MFRIITALLLLLWGSSAFSQVNYVLNPDLEDYTFCPNAFDQIYAARHWHSLDTMNTFAVSGHPEYCHRCAGTNIMAGTPQNGYFFQEPHSGNGMAQIQTLYFKETNPPGAGYYYRDYLQGRLRKKLVAGTRYCVSFWVNLTEISGYAIKEISAYLDNGSIDTTKSISLPQKQYQPQITNVNGLLSDTMRWVKIEGSFIAKGSEEFITIGNFQDKAGTTHVISPYNGYNSSSTYSLYLVDDVSVIESDLKADAGPDRTMGLGDSTYIGRPKEVGLECSWTVLGSSTVIGTGAGIWVKPKFPTRYVVSQTLCGVTKKDTVWVGVWGVGVSNLNGATQTYSLSPNPSKGIVQLMQAVADGRQISIQVVEAMGRVVHQSQQSFRDGKLSLDLSGLAPGCYFVRVRDADGLVSSLRMLKE